jgi:hypothetical protein
MENSGNVGWTKSKILLLIVTGALVLTAVSLWIVGLFRFKYGDGDSAVYFLVIGFVLNFVGLGVIPQIARRYWS